MFDIIKNILISEKEFSKTNYERPKKSFSFHKKIKMTICTWPMIL